MMMMGLNVLKEQLGVERFRLPWQGTGRVWLSLPGALRGDIGHPKGWHLPLGSSCCSQGGVQGGTGCLESVRKVCGMLGTW